MLDPDHPGLEAKRYTTTVDAGCGFDGPLLAACLTLGGEVVDTVEG